MSLQDISEPVDPVVRVGDDVSEDGLPLLLVLVALSPPRLLHADVHVGVSEALGPDNVEKHVANSVSELGVGHLEASTKPEMRTTRVRFLVGRSGVDMLVTHHLLLYCTELLYSRT